MTTKYHRETDVQRTREVRKTPWMRQGPVVRRLTRRQTFTVFAGFLLSAGLLSQLALRRATATPFSGRPVVRGTGIVVRKEAGPAGGGIVTLEVRIDAEHSLSAERAIPDPYWEAMETGTRLAVIYQTDRTGSLLRIVECGIVALPGEIR